MWLFLGFGGFGFFDFGFFGFVDVDAVDLDVGGKLILDGFEVFNEEVFEDDGEADDDEEGGEDNFPGGAPVEDALSGEKQNDAEGEHEEAAGFELFCTETDEARDDDKESPPAVKEQFECEQSERFAAEEDA